MLFRSGRRSRTSAAWVARNAAIDMPSVPGVADRAARQLTEFLAGRRKDFDLPLHRTGTAFQRAVLDEVSRIPYGATVSYGEVAAALGRPRAFRGGGSREWGEPASARDSVPPGNREFGPPHRVRRRSLPETVAPEPGVRRAARPGFLKLPVRGSPCSETPSCCSFPPASPWPSRPGAGEAMEPKVPPPRPPQETPPMTPSETCRHRT